MSTAIIYEGQPGTRVQTPVATIVAAEHDQIAATAQELVVAGALGDSARVGAVMFGFESLESPPSSPPKASRSSSSTAGSGPPRPPVSSPQRAAATR